MNRALPLVGARILVAGCGTGRDVPSWLPHRPARIVGVDYFEYPSEWAALQERARVRHPYTELIFRAANLENLSLFPDASFDIVASDAVLEHVRRPEPVVREIHRILRPGGLMYATYGPLWHTWGGDHISGYDGLQNGFNHLLLGPEEYAQYLDAAGPYHHSEDDGRTWVRNDMFSYLKPHEYLDVFRSAGLRPEFTGILIEPRAVRCLRQFPAISRVLLEHHQYFDLIVNGMTVLCRRPPLHV